MFGIEDGEHCEMQTESAPGETLETVATFTDLTRAQSARSALEAAGILSWFP